MFVSIRPVFGRLGTGDGKNFDARQKIGQNDARQRFQVKDAREKLVQKDARFKIRGRGGAAAGGVQDARQMINSRKQGQSQSQQFTTTIQGLIPQVIMDARDRLSLKRSIGGAQTQTAAEPPLKITKTIQVRVQKVIIIFFLVLTNPKSARSSSFNDYRLAFQQRPAGTLGGIRAMTQVHLFSFSIIQDIIYLQRSMFSITAPITKVVKNDAYTAPRPPVPVAPTRPNTSTAAARSSAAALQPPAFSPLEGTKITVSNLHPRVSEEDIMELFCVCGALKRARLVKVGVAEVVFVRKEDAVSAYRRYNTRCLDGQPMKCNLHIQGTVITSDQPILLSSGGGTKKDGLPPSLSRPSGQRASSQPTTEVDPQTILKALFKSTTQSTSTTEAPSSQTTAFRIKI
uniref:Polymerase (DNA-directed), delta interacting protein 3 n=1 Tax=Xiphophorus couchianus TaxID=32473 RepID=A0A3B5MAN7_9TELE